MIKFLVICSVLFYGIDFDLLNLISKMFNIRILNLDSKYFLDNNLIYLIYLY